MGGSLALAAAALVAAPALIGIGYAAAGALDLLGAATAPTTERLTRVLGDASVWRGAVWSLWVAGCSTALAACAAVAVASLFPGSSRGARLARAFAVLPLPVPHVVAAFTALLVLSQSGVIARLGHAAGLVSTPADMPPLVYDAAGIAVILALSWKEFPFLALLAFTLVAGRGIAAEEAARTHGAGRWQTWRRVTLPLLWRGLLPGVVAVFIFAAGSYEVAALLAPTSPRALPLLVEERYTAASLAARGDAYVLTLIALVLAVIAVGVHERVRARAEREAGDR